MNETTKLYDRICTLLTDYENPQDAPVEVTIEEFYDLLVDIQNNWDTITNNE